MEAIYLIHAKTPAAIALLKEEGALQFSSDTFLWGEDPLDPIQFAQSKKAFSPDDYAVLDIFSPDTPNDLRYDHPQKAEIKKLFLELHRIAFNWSKHYET